MRSRSNLSFSFREDERFERFKGLILFEVISVQKENFRALFVIIIFYEGFIIKT